MRYVVWRRHLDQPGHWGMVDDFVTEIDALDAALLMPSFDTMQGEMIELDYIVLPEGVRPLGRNPKKRRRNRHEP